MPTRPHRSSGSGATASQVAGITYSRSLINGIVATAMDAVIVCDGDQNIVLFNHAAELMFLMTGAAALGRPVSDLIPERFRAAHREQVEQFGRQEPAGPRSMSTGRLLFALRSSGEEFPAEASISAMTGGGKPFYTVILRDVTARQRDREALVRSNLDLQQFAFVASHDLRSPLRSIQGFLSLLLSRHAHSLDSHALDIVNRAIRAAEHMDDLTRDLLDYARLNDTAGKMGPVLLDNVLDQARQVLQPSIAECSATLTGEALPTVHGDQRQLVQLLQNLIGNALKYRSERPADIRVRADRADNEWVISVADNGIGIEPRHLPRIFNIFERLHAQHEYPGTGIGLAICKRIVERHGGRLWAESVPGTGSTFYFTIPDKGAP